MIPSEWVAAFQSLERGTRAGALDWEHQQSSQTVRVSLSDSTIVLKRYRTRHPFSEPLDGPSPEGVRIQLLDAQGEVVDAFELLDTDEEGQRTRGLYESARRKALGIDVLLQDVAQELQNLRTSARS